MDPILDAMTAMPIEPARPAAPEAATRTEAGDAARAPTPAEASITDEQLAQYTETAAAFVGQMYMTLWREAQRNSG